MTAPESQPEAQIHLDNAPRLLTARQVAFVLDLSLPAVRALARRGVLRTYRLGGENLFATEAVRELRRAHPVRSAA